MFGGFGTFGPETIPLAELVDWGASGLIGAVFATAPGLVATAPKAATCVAGAAGEKDPKAHNCLSITNAFSRYS